MAPTGQLPAALLQDSGPAEIRKGKKPPAAAGGRGVSRAKPRRVRVCLASEIER
jgi:hypothetical protein